MLKLSQIKKSYGQNLVLPKLDLSIERGEILALVGESGCGKTTILRILAGLENIDSGAIELNGENITQLKSSERKVGMVFQDLALFPHLTVRKNIEFGALSNDKVDELIEKTGLDDFQHRYPHELSGGQQQRVALARTLAAEPDILLLDEPFSSLDELTHEAVRNEIHGLIKEFGITTILVTHHPIDSFMMADQVAVLKSGALLQKGSPENIYQNPVDAYTAKFFGSCIILSSNSSFGRMNIESDMFMIRSEYVTLNKLTGPLSGIVKDTLFKGSKMVVVLASKDERETLTIETDHSDITIGDQIYLHPQLDRIKLLEK